MYIISVCIYIYICDYMRNMHREKERREGESHTVIIWQGVTGTCSVDPHGSKVLSGPCLAVLGHGDLVLTQPSPYRQSLTEMATKTTRRYFAAPRRLHPEIDAAMHELRNRMQ